MTKKITRMMMQNIEKTLQQVAQLLPGSCSINSFRGSICSAYQMVTNGTFQARQWLALETEQEYASEGYGCCNELLVHYSSHRGT
jgi:Fe-S-cluster containining protein